MVASSHRQLLFDVAVGPFGEEVQDPMPATFRTLLDTGAQCTCVAPNLIAALNIDSAGVGFLIPANGEPLLSNQYY